MLKRTLGRTGESLSVIGFGGIVVRDTSAAEADRLVGQAVDRGINLFDVAPSYGNAEERLGPALAPLRDRVFLSCKTAKRSAREARAELEQSLARLRTDRFDLYQCHGVASLEEAEKVLAPGGALEALVAAREKGLVRYLGFSAHSEEAALRMFEAFAFDAVMLPVNLFCWQQGGFGRRVCEEATRRGIGIIGLKALCKRPWRPGETRAWPKCWYLPIESLPEGRIALAFALSRPVAAVIPPGYEELLWLACDALQSLGDPPWDEADRPVISGEPLFAGTCP